MVTRFKLVGLEKLHNKHRMSATLEPIGYETTFKSLFKFPEKAKEELWDFCMNDWEEKKFADVEHDGFLSDGVTPNNPLIISISLIP